MPQMRTPRPAQQPYTQVVHDEAGDGRQPSRKVIPRQQPMYVDGKGNATKALPSQSRALVPAGPVTGTSVVPVAQPAPQAAPKAAAQPGRADFYSNSRGETGRGGAPSSSRAVVPAGPVTSPAGPAPAEPLRLTGPKPEPVVREPDYRARAETMGRAKADTAAWQAEQAKQDARFAQAAQQHPSGRPMPRGSLRSRLPQGKVASAAGTGAVVGAGEAMNVYDVAQDPNSSKADVATQVAEGVGRSAATIAGAELGAAAGAAVGGPFAPVTAIIGGIGGGALGYWGSDQAIRAGREAVGVDPSSPIDRVPQEPVAPANTTAQATPSAQQVKTDQQAPQTDQQQPKTDQQAPQSVTQQGNGYVRTGIGAGAQGGEIVARVGEGGVPEFTNDKQAQQGATSGQLPFTRPMRQSPSNDLVTPAGATELARGSYTPTEEQQFAAQGSAANLGDGVGTFSQAEAGDSALALQRFERANEIRASMKPARQIGDNGGRVTVIADSSRAPNETEIRRARHEERLARTEALRSETENAALEAQGSVEDRAQQRQESASRIRTNEQALEKGQIDLASAQRLQELYDLYDAADPATRASIAEEIRVMTGKDLPDRFMVVPGGQEYDPQAMAVINRPSYVMNKQTGEIGGQAAKPVRTSVSRAEVEATAKKRGMSVEEVTKQLNAKGVTVNG